MIKFTLTRKSGKYTWRKLDLNFSFNLMSRVEICPGMCFSPPLLCGTLVSQCAFVNMYFVLISDQVPEVSRNLPSVAVPLVEYKVVFWWVAGGEMTLNNSVTQAGSLIERIFLDFCLVLRGEQTLRKRE